MSILIIDGHPTQNSFCQQLASAYAEGAEAHTAVRILSLRALTFDGVSHQAEQALEPDLVEAQALITAADHVVFVAPVWWCGLPALLKGFIDRTFLTGWAFKMRPNGFPVGLLSGRSARLIMTMDTPKPWYQLTWRTQAHRAFEIGTLKFCGLGPRSRTLVFSVRTLDATGRARWLNTVRQQGKADALRVTKARALKAQTPGGQTVAPPVSQGGRPPAA